MKPYISAGGVGRAFMTCVTEIDSDWIPAHAKASNTINTSSNMILPNKNKNKSNRQVMNQHPHLLLKLSKPLESYTPCYDEDEDCIKCHVTPSFGTHSWNLKPIPIPMRETKSTQEDETRHFAKYVEHTQLI